MPQVKNGDTIKIHYQGRLADGTVFDSSEGRDPLQFTVGGGMVIPGFDAGVKDMNIGDKKTIHIPAAEAYGDKQDHLIIEFPKDQFPPDLNPEVGMQLNMSSNTGQVIPVEIVEVKEGTVMLDANHQLAGKDLIFDLELMEINGSGKSRIIMP